MRPCRAAAEAETVAAEEETAAGTADDAPPPGPIPYAQDTETFQDVFAFAGALPEVRSAVGNPDLGFPGAAARMARIAEGCGLGYYTIMALHPSCLQLRESVTRHLLPKMLLEERRLRLRTAEGAVSTLVVCLLGSV